MSTVALLLTFYGPGRKEYFKILPVIFAFLLIVSNPLASCYSLLPLEWARHREFQWEAFCQGSSFQLSSGLAPLKHCALCIQQYLAHWLHQTVPSLSAHLLHGAANSFGANSSFPSSGPNLELTYSGKVWNTLLSLTSFTFLMQFAKTEKLFFSNISPSDFLLSPLILPILNPGRHYSMLIHWTLYALLW